MLLIEMDDIDSDGNSYVLYSFLGGHDTMVYLKPFIIG
jgi:hypothetical protein